MHYLYKQLNLAVFQVVRIGIYHVVFLILHAYTSDFILFFLLSAVFSKDELNLVLQLQMEAS